MMESDNVSMGTLFVPDVMMPAQFYDERRDDPRIRPVKRLMLAVLEDALRCFQNNLGAKSELRRRLFKEAEDWLCGNGGGGDGPFSFETVCETLGIEPRFLRQGLRQWREQQAAGATYRRLARRSPVVRTGRIRAHTRRRRRKLASNG